MSNKISPGDHSTTASTEGQFEHRGIVLEEVAALELGTAAAEGMRGAVTTLRQELGRFKLDGSSSAQGT